MCEYFELVAEATECGKGNANPVFAEMLREMVEDMSRRPPDSGIGYPLYIHLKDAEIGLGALMIRRALWRGLLDRVDGFTFYSPLPKG
jgi:hypothetical protein